MYLGAALRLAIPFAILDRQDMHKAYGGLGPHAALAKKSKEPLSIESQGKNEKACQIPLAELSARGSFPPAKAIDGCGRGKSQIVISPVPDLT